jgi:hypothetical protein
MTGRLAAPDDRLTIIYSSIVLANNAARLACGGRAA